MAQDFGSRREASFRVRPVYRGKTRPDSELGSYLRIEEHELRRAGHVDSWNAFRRHVAYPTTSLGRLRRSDSPGSRLKLTRTPRDGARHQEFGDPSRRSLARERPADRGAELRGGRFAESRLGRGRLPGLIRIVPAASRRAEEQETCLREESALDRHHAGRSLGELGATVCLAATVAPGLPGLLYGDDPDLASYLRIEERELEAG